MSIFFSRNSFFIFWFTILMVHELSSHPFSYFDPWLICRCGERRILWMICPLVWRFKHFKNSQAFYFTFFPSLVKKKLKTQRDFNSDRKYRFSYFRWLNISTPYPNLPSAVIIVLANDCNWCLLELTANLEVWISDVVHLSSSFSHWVCFEEVWHLKTETR